MATLSQPPPTVPNGGTARVTGSKFVAGVSVSLIAPEPARARIGFELPLGLSWGSDFRDPSEGCTSTASAVECQSPPLEPLVGRSDFGWAWDIVAAQPGTYTLNARIIESSPPDTVASNDSSAVTVVVLPRVTTGSVALAPAKPRAGAAFAATVRVTADGSPVAPSGIACKATVGGAHVRRSGKSTRGAASCTFRTPRSAKGKLLRGTISFSAGGTRFTRRFSTTLR